ncbi:MAG: hypothetical protein PHY59_07600 [Methanobacterium sp.]|nr:hypothetical protein [Methanobacterium sp.]
MGGGYFVELYQGSGNFSLNVTNNTPVNDTLDHKALNITPTKNNTNKTNNTPAKNNSSIIF